MHAQRIVGVLGGMGPYAGLDLVSKIFDETLADMDQEHLPVALLSFSHRFRDRSAFILGRIQENPGLAIAEVARQLDGLGAHVAGMPCNSAHAPAIFDTVCEELRASGHSIRMLHMIREAISFARHALPGVRRIGPLSTLAVHKLGLYRQAIESAGFEAIMPDENVAESLVDKAIFAPGFGIKAASNPVTERARSYVMDAIQHLKGKRAEAVILGCTELPLAVTKADGVLLIDPARALARALIRETYPDRLAPVARLR